MNSQSIVDQIPALRRYARALTGDAWAADDLVQDTLERACSKWRLWAVGSNLRAWLFTLMHNLFANSVRTAKRQSPDGTVDIDDVAHEFHAADPGVDQAIDLQRCLLRLPMDQRAVLLLVSLEDMSYADVARITAVPMGTVMSRLSRARRHLQELLDEPARTAQPASATGKPTGSVTPLRRVK
ncbi:MAG: RNA polymerase sigma factor [Gammaproteobacteria bacterium]|uniref:RNA polymerase sigma factor n=1 Tax=Rhodoferax sp. TaxID=50421 RepID=UPI0017D2BB60|nr:RNA polymerase sigma factor [Rhodoferax sp.]MBU3899720.1 RNA polymerase sigma factor [Gammaproteobacteria bacterium]MBA3056758.1 RNA polymerase sigma factor [Rhodoferax sp.]MBU3996287.1 RNA polymerase sigma factor [Gammaproteobacteria bacterium]MBU4018196.1 RNA polymerase sigma factor [Gammaproteobacteria bacterium]MBU4080113.1 RNA polymerase sigma factor [Gammaproteobacteria bacterium]